MVLIVCLCVVPAFAAQDPFSLPVGTVVIDAGHGGHDPGASYTWPFVGHVVYERDLTLDIAKRLSVLLTLSHPELTVVMTRSSDVYLSLSERSAIASGLDWGAMGALFVSIHINSANAPSANGFEVLTKRQDKPVSSSMKRPRSPTSTSLPPIHRINSTDCSTTATSWSPQSSRRRWRASWSPPEAAV